MSANILTLNVDELADLKYGGRTIPFEAERFGAVVSLDTLEHVPPDDRLSFLQECACVTRRFNSQAVSYRVRQIVNLADILNQEQKCRF